MNIERKGIVLNYTPSGLKLENKFYFLVYSRKTIQGPTPPIQRCCYITVNFVTDVSQNVVYKTHQMCQIDIINLFYDCAIIKGESEKQFILFVMFRIILFLS
jgi:hypothetical protein